MHALPWILGALCVMVIAYRYYSAFIAARVLVLDDARVTPAHRLKDGQNFEPTNKWVLFGHHFAAISGAGPLIGPVLAAQFGFLPGFLWLLVGVVLAGAVHDFTTLVASVRRNGRSLADIARNEISPLAGLAGSIAILIILVIALAGLGLAVVNALRDSSWGTFTIAMTIPIAIFVGLWMRTIRPGKITEASVIGVVAVVAAVIGGSWIPGSALAPWFTLSQDGIVLALVIYGFLASVLPVWLLLVPRDYLSSYMKIGTIAALVVGVVLVNPELKMPSVTQFIGGGGPILPGKLFPFLFVTIACGAISGFHSLVASGTTPKMVARESDTRMIGYGAMLMEGLVGIVALIAACALEPADYFAINVPPAVYQTLGMSPVNLAELSREVGENVAGRTGGAVSLAVGFAQIFTALPGLAAVHVVLVPLRDHVRGALHPHDDRRGHARCAVHGAGVRRELLEAVRTDGLAPCERDRDDPGGGVLGVLPVDGQYQHDLAHVRDGQSAARGGGALGRDQHPDQRRESALRVDHGRADGVRRGHDADRGGAQCHGQLLADDREAGDSNAGVRELRADGGDDPVRHHGPVRGRQEVVQDPDSEGSHPDRDAGTRPPEDASAIRRVLLTGFLH